MSNALRMTHAELVTLQPALLQRPDKNPAKDIGGMVHVEVKA